METNDAVQSLAALSQETRLNVYRLLVQAGADGLAAGQIGEQLGLPPATLSFHLAHLSRANLIRSRQDGRFVFYSADFATMAALIQYLTDNCCSGALCSTTECKPPAGSRGSARRRAGVAAKA